MRGFTIPFGLVLPGGIVVPGLIEAGVPLGLFEVGSESDTMDGFLETFLLFWHFSSVSSSPHGVEELTSSIMAIDGVHLQTRHTYSAWVAGVTGIH